MPASTSSACGTKKPRGNRTTAASHATQPAAVLPRNRRTGRVTHGVSTQDATSIEKTASARTLSMLHMGICQTGPPPQPITRRLHSCAGSSSQTARTRTAGSRFHLRGLIPRPTLTLSRFLTGLPSLTPPLPRSAASLGSSGRRARMAMSSICWVGTHHRKAACWSSSTRIFPSRSRVSFLGGRCCRCPLMGTIALLGATTRCVATIIATRHA
mmetsp:Transcript_27871/g.56087  ORF Transcript_27871/g.56087 Transcript_27871/m.56087 type:complete len:213 (+) Transcript_27871:206-844(+)